MKKQSEDIIWILVIILCISSLTFLGTYGTPYNLDHVIIFSGGYSISSGLVPYIDFPLPPFPLPFLLQAFFQLLFGSNLIAMLVHTIVLSSLLCVFFYYISKDYVGKFISAILSVLLFYGYIGMIAYPWYNQHAIFFFLINVFLLFLSLRKKISLNFVLISSAILAFLGILSKTDIGVFHAFFILIYFAYSYQGQWKDVAKSYLLPLIVSTGGFILLVRLISSEKNLTFTSGIILQRLSHFLNIIYIERLIYTSYFYVILFLIFFAIYFKIDIKNYKSNFNKFFFLFLISNVAMTFITLLSGQVTQSRLGMLVVNVFFFYILCFSKSPVQDRERKIRVIIAFILFLVIFNGYAFLGYYGSGPQFKSSTQQFKYIFLGTPTYERENVGCYDGQLFDKEQYHSLSKIREAINGSESFFVTGAFTFLYCDYDRIPPKHLPIWFHGGATMPLNSSQHIAAFIDQEKPTVVVEEFYGIAGELERGTFEKLMYERGYELFDRSHTQRSNHNISVYKLAQ